MSDTFGPNAAYGAGDPALVVEAMREEAQRAQAIRDELADLVGTATSDDGLITAHVGGRGLQELVFEPKVMRLPSGDLASTVVAVTQQARHDFETRRQERMAELGAPPQPDLEESLEQLDRLKTMVEGGHGDMRAVFERFRDQATGRG